MGNRRGTVTGLLLLVGAVGLVCPSSGGVPRPPESPTRPPAVSGAPPPVPKAPEAPRPGVNPTAGPAASATMPPEGVPAPVRVLLQTFSSLYARKDLASLLPGPGGVLLEYAVLPGKTILFVVTAGERRGGDVRVSAHEIPVAATELARRVREFRQRLAEKDPACERLGAALYQLLCRPASAALEGKTSVVVVPDDVLGELPFAALQPRRGRFLAETAAVTYLPSLSVGKAMKPAAMPRKAPENLLAFGNPSPGPGAPGSTGGPLPEAEREVRDIAAGFRGNDREVLIGADATEKAFKEKAPGFRILHLATHGVLDNAAPLYSYLALAPDPSAFGEDGRLEAREILALDTEGGGR